MDIKPGALLATINEPKDMKSLNEDQLLVLSAELRQFIIDMVSVNGGHFGASLGVVELTVALHYVFNTPYDQLVWDVGHQAYGHKILTGRRDNFYTNRTLDGISGFPRRSESEYDTFGVGHSSTSISAALGMAVASNYKNESTRQHIAVIGDGALTAGLAFEGLNNAGVEKSNLLVILNDNCMSIDPNVGALKEYLRDMSASYMYNQMRKDVWNILGAISKFGPDVRHIVRKVAKTIKGGFFGKSNFFESLSFRYFGPVDGHDLPKLIKILKDLESIPGPKILHCITVKGKGFSLAEKDQTLWHAPGLFDKITGEIKISVSDKPKPPKYQDVFGITIVELAKQNDRIMGITPAMPSGSSMNLMMKEMPQRAFDVGIAEQHAVTFSAGLATQGMIPFCNIYSTFMQRAYDQVIHDVALQNLPVIFCLDRAGFAGADGATHHGAYDIAYMRCIPNLIVSAPLNEIELRNLMYTAQLDPKSPFVIRYPRGNGVICDWQKPFQKIPIGKGQKISEGEDIAILTIGPVGNYVIESQKTMNENGFFPAHYDMRFVKPIDKELLHKVCRNFKKIITIEDGCIMGGLGSAILEFIADHNYMGIMVKRLGIPDEVIEQGEQLELHHLCGFDPEGIISAVKTLSSKQTANLMAS